MTQETAVQPGAAAPEAQEAEAPNILDDIISKSRMARSDTERERARDLIGEMVNQVLDGTIIVSRDLVSALEARIAELDQRLSEQLSEVMHAPEFQQLESSWRGLKYLVDQSETGTHLKISVLNASKQELVKDLKSASEFDQSAVFKKVYTEEYDTFGGAPFAALIGDYEFTNHPQDQFLLEEMSHVAAAAHAPFISAAGADMFGMDSFTELNAPRDLAKIFDTVEYAKWKSMRDSDDSRYVALTLPHVLGRLPYGKTTDPVEAFDFEEEVDGTDHGKYLWTNAAYTLGARLTDAFAKHGWCAAIRGVEGGGLVEGLPVHTFTTREGEVAMKCPTETVIPERRARELRDLGFTPLEHCKGTDYAAFFDTPSVQKPKQYDQPAANANARLSAQLQYIMAVSRIAHYLKAICRDKIGSFGSRGNVENFLNKWLAQYILLDDDAGQEAKAKKPLREARVEVSEIPGRPGCYNAVAFLRPHFQLDELTVSLRLVAELPAPAR